MNIIHVRKYGLSWFLVVFHIMTYWQCGSVFYFLQNLVWPINYKDGPCAHGTSVFAMKFRKSLWKFFYKQEIIKILTRNNTEKRQVELLIMIMIMTCHAEIGTEIAMLFVFDIRLPASGWISMLNRFVDGWIRFCSSIMLMFLPTVSVTTENVSGTSKALAGDNGSTTLCSVVIPNLTCFKAFRYIRICQRNSGYYPKDLLRWRSRRLDTFLGWTFCNIYIFIAIALDESSILVAVHFSMTIIYQSCDLGRAVGRSNVDVSQ